MGLISYIKNKYYDRSLRKACQLLSNGQESEAEAKLLSLVDKHPLAASKLAEYYLSISPSSDVNTAISFFKKSLDLGHKCNNVCDVISYNKVISDFVKHLKERAVSCFDNGAYEDCSVLTIAMVDSKHALSDDAILGAEARIRLILEGIKGSRISDKSFLSLVESFKKEWSVCLSQERTKKHCLFFCDELSYTKRYYTSNLLLEIILKDPFDDKCLNNATAIVKGADVEATDGVVSSVAAKYCKKIVLRKGIKPKEAVTIFNACWKYTSDEKIVMDVLQSAKNSDFEKTLVSHFIDKHKEYLSIPPLFKSFSKWVYETFEGQSALQLLENLHKLGYNVEDYFTKKTHSVISKMKCDDRLHILDHAQSLFPNSSLVINDKLECAQAYLNENENEKAIEVSDSILEKNETAKLVKAQALCNLAYIETDLDKRVSIIECSENTFNSYQGSKGLSTEERIMDSYVKSADLFYDKGEKDRAYSILTRWAKKGYKKAIISIASHRLSEVQLIKQIADKGIAAANALTELNEYDSAILIDNSDFQQLWDEKIASIIDRCKKEDNNAAVDTLEKLLKEVELVGFEVSVLDGKRDKIVKGIVKRKYLIARELEVSDNHKDAASLYKQIVFLEAKRNPTLAAMRFTLCKFKTASSMEVLEHKDQIYSLLKKAPSALKAERDDITYRFALLLLKSGEDKEALAVLNEYLPTEEYLKKACEQGEIIKAIAKLEDFNNKIESVKNHSLPAEDTIYFLNHLLEYANTIRPILDIPRSALQEYRNKLKNYAIFKLFDEERYNVAFEKLIKEHQDYLDDYTALRNIAIVCLNMAEAKQLTKSNYKEVISVWLTAIYQEQLFIESLDYTSWDDQYTFSLDGAYGHFDEYTHDDLPDNVNYDDPNDNDVVAIREVQRTLLDRFEAAISDVRDYHVFYNSEKDAMDRFIALNLDEKCRMVAPFISHKDDAVFQDIHDALEQDRQEGYENWEDVLYVGSLYQMPESIYEEYSFAKLHYEDCINVINMMNAEKVTVAFESAAIDLIRKFDKLSSALISYAKSKVSSLSSDSKNEFKRNYDFYLLICNAIKDDTLSFIFSNYVMQYVVGEVNSESMGKAAAANIIISIYLLDKNNGRVRDNLTTLFEMLVHENTPAASKAVAMLLDKLKNFDPITFQKLNNENEQAKIDKELNGIVDKVNKRTMSESDALGKVYDLYSINPQNSRLCENLAQLCEICIMKYIANQESGSMSVCRTLDKLKVNKSRTFNNHNGNLGAAYRKIWGQLPSDAKLTLMGLNPNATLNASGQALKKALDYFKALGGISETSSLRDILF